MQTLDPQRIIAFLRDHDFGGAFRREDIKPSFRFVERASDPDQDFLDPALEDLRSKLAAAARALSKGLALRTAPTRGNSVSSFQRSPGA